MGIEFAAIPPIAHVRKFPQKYHLILAHLLEVSPGYLRYYQHLQRSDVRRGKYLILDNGAYELGRSITTEQLFKWAVELGVDEVALPDVLFNSSGTIRRATEGLRYLHEHESEFQNVRIMIVPQGRDGAEWRWCCRQVYLKCVEFGIRNLTVGIPKHATRWAPYNAGRLELIPYARQYGPIHLLGTDDELLEIPRLGSTYPSVRSVDSARPIVYAMAGIRLSDRGEPPGRNVIHRPEGYFDVQLEEDAFELAKRNVRAIRLALKAQTYLEQASV